MRLRNAHCEMWSCDINSHITIPGVLISHGRTSVHPSVEGRRVCKHTCIHAQIDSLVEACPTSITLLSSTQTVDSLPQRQEVLTEVCSLGGSSSVCLCVLVFSVQKRGVSANDGVHTPSCHFITACRQTHYIQHLLPSRTLRVCKCVCVDWEAFMQVKCVNLP